MLQLHSVYDEISYGIIPIAYNEDSLPCVFMVQHNAGHWAFPKGRIQKNESGKSCAERECYEETKLQVDTWLPIKPVTEEYIFTRFGKKVRKQVTYFFARVCQDSTTRPFQLPRPILQTEEVQRGGFFLLHELENKATYLEAKKSASEVVKKLSLFAIL